MQAACMFLGCNGLTSSHWPVDVYSEPRKVQEYAHWRPLRIFAFAALVPLVTSGIVAPHNLLGVVGHRSKQYLGDYECKTRYSPRPASWMWSKQIPHFH